MDHNHNHFIFVDDGSRDMYGKEIALRANIETELRKGKSYSEYFCTSENIDKYRHLDLKLDDPIPYAHKEDDENIENDVPMV